MTEVFGNAYKGDLCGRLCEDRYRKILALTVVMLSLGGQPAGEVLRGRQNPREGWWRLGGHGRACDLKCIDQGVFRFKVMVFWYKELEEDLRKRNVAVW